MLAQVLRSHDAHTDFSSASLPAGGPPKSKTVSIPTAAKLEPRSTYDIVDLLRCVVAEGASDLHIMAGRPPVIRLHGELVPVEGASMDAEAVAHAAGQFFAAKGTEGERLKTEDLERKGSADFAIGLMIKYQTKAGGIEEVAARFRVNVAKFDQCLGITARLIPSKIKTLNELCVPSQIKDLLTKQRGLILVVGPTGSGKTTTLAAMVDHINTERSDKKVITIEDPIEFVHRHKAGLVLQREVPSQVPSFADGVVQSLRQNPDVILVGEMRTKEDMNAALTAAETGHLVFATLHTSGAASTVQRFVGQFSEGEQESIKTKLAMNLVAVVSQLLVPTIDGQGRIAIFEILTNTPAVAEHIRKDPKHINNAIETGSKQGMMSFDSCLFERFQQGLISERVALEKCYDLASMGERFRRYHLGSR